MADLVQTPIIKLTPSGSDDPGATWMAATEPVAGGLGRRTVRKKYPTGGAGMMVDADGVVSALVDDDSIKVGDDGRLYAPSVKSNPVVLVSEPAEVKLVAKFAPDEDCMLPVTVASANPDVTVSGGEVIVSGKVTWITVTVSATAKCPGHEDNFTIVPLVVSVDGVARTYRVDTTEAATEIVYTGTVYDPGKEARRIPLHAYLDADDNDSISADVRLAYTVTVSGV